MTSLFIQPKLSFECRVEKTKMSCHEALTAISAVSLSLISPIEYQIEGINQVQCKNELGLNFATILRSLLRQDPDILMIGELEIKKQLK